MEQDERIRIVVDGSEVYAARGETVAAALMAHGLLTLRQTEKGAPRGVFCGMGVCFDCLVCVDGVEEVRACLTQVCEGMHIKTGGRRNG